jgi:hypothetical protein
MTHWRFVSSCPGFWIWERERNVNGVRHIDRGQPQASRHACIEDAIANHGFRVQDSWNVVGRELTAVVETPPDRDVDARDRD